MAALGSRFRNWTSWSGLLLSAAAIFAFVFLFVLDQAAGSRNPYVGILAYVIAPGFFFLGLAIAIAGALIHWRHERKTGQVEARLVNIDLSRPRDRHILIGFGAAAGIFLLATAIGSYETYHLTESVEFCGKACHVPMEPEFVSAQHNVHARVECVDCHVGPGAAAYVRTKINGVRQLYHTFKGDFPRPIFVSAHNPRPPQMICEQCHWPERHIGDVEKTYQHYLSDEKNTPFAVRLLLKVGGGAGGSGVPDGIHWHMNIANKIEYIAADKDRLAIPWVRVTNAQGVVTEYRDPEFKDDISHHQVQRMDCMDCHSQPSHRFRTPNETVDSALSSGRLDPNTPWVKSKVVTALTKPYATRAEAEKGIADELRAAYPDPVQGKRVIDEALAIYKVNFYPEMKTDWRTHPNFIGHKDWNGCFRCHDGKHLAADGKTSIKASDCNSCHLILAQGSGEQLTQLNSAGHPFIHIDSEFSDFSCADCHTGGIQK